MKPSLKNTPTAPLLGRYDITSNEFPSYDIKPSDSGATVQEF